MRSTWREKTEYELLEIPEDATLAEIKYAWLFQIKAWHPDKFPSDYTKEVTERFQAIKDAYEVLSSPALRKRLDRSLGIDNENDSTKTDAPQFKKKEQLVSESWKALARWAKEEDQLTPKGRSFAYSVGDQYLEKGRALSESQLKWANDIWDEAIRSGFDPGADA